MQDFLVVSIILGIGILLKIEYNTRVRGLGAIANALEKIEQNTRWRGRS